MTIPPEPQSPKPTGTLTFDTASALQATATGISHCTHTHYPIPNDPHGRPPRHHSHLPAEVAEELPVLRDLHLLDGLPEGGAVARTVLADDPNLLRALGLKNKSVEI